MDIDQIVTDFFTAEESSAEAMLAEFFDFDAASSSSAPTEANSQTTFADASRSSTTITDPNCGVTEICKECLEAIFIRIDRIYIIVDGVADDFRWNKRSKTWRDNEGRDVQLIWLLENPGPLINVSIRPDGLDYPVLLEWDPEERCFKGTTMDDHELIVSHEELKDMADDPWARQFEGFITG